MRAWWLASLVLLAACDAADDASGVDGVAGADAANVPGDDVASPDQQGEAELDGAPEEGEVAPRRGLGTVTARVPGTKAVIGGVRLVSHRARVIVQDGFARTEIEEEFLNETGQVLEGRYVFPIPEGATVSRLALWVGTDLVEGEILERTRANRIFRGIVEDTVRPRDPALLEWVRGSELSLTIFPIPAKGSRKVLLAYDEALGRGEGGTRYVHALTTGPERATPIADFALSLRVVGAEGARPSVPGFAAHVSTQSDDAVVDFAATDLLPERDFEVLLGDATDEANLVTFSGTPGSGARDARGYFAARIEVPQPVHGMQRQRGDRVVVLDTSDSQTKATIAAQVRLVDAMAASMAPDERLTVLACDAACESFPTEGGADLPSRVGLEPFLASLKPHGASDLAGAIVSGAGRLDDPGGGGVLVVLHDGTPTAGELTADRAIERLAPVLQARGVDLRLVGVGRSVDAVALGALSHPLGASLHALAGPGSLATRAKVLAERLGAVQLRGAQIVLPPTFEAVPFAHGGAIPLGEPITLFGTLSATTDLADAMATLRGRLGDEEVSFQLPLRAAVDRRPNPLLPKLWADRTIAAWESEDGRRDAIIALSREHHVLSRHTALLVLENERMFREFGVERTTLRPQDQGDHGFGGADAEAGAAPGADGSLGRGSPLPDGAPGDTARTGSHHAKAPQLRMGSTSVSGRLPPETVQRIVRMNQGRFRACYERGLQRNPALAGRIVTRFVIARDGRVGSTADAGSDLPDSEVVACVVRSFSFLDFPQPEGGLVTVTYPLVFSSDGTRPSRPATLWPEVAPAPRKVVERSQPVWTPPRPVAPEVTISVQHLPGEETWRTLRDGSIEALAAASDRAPESRAKRERWVRALLLQGKFEGARAEAATFAEMDPDLPLARELLAQAASAAGETHLALSEVGALVEIAPRSRDAQLRAARAFEAAGDVRRACAFRRALAEPGRAAGDRARAEACWELLAAGTAVAPSEAVSTAGGYRATVQCEGDAACPRLVVVTPSGRAITREAPFGAEPLVTGVALAWAGEGTYRALLVGGAQEARGTVHVVAHGRARDVPFTRGGEQTVLTTRIQETWKRGPRVRY